MANRKITFSKTKLARSIAVNRAGKAKQLGVAAALMLGTSSVGALGLGTLEIDSNLDQPLKGTIELNAQVGDDLDTVTAVIASREDFDSLGIDYPNYLKDISLSVDKNSSGTTLLVSSQNVVIREPFIHFLVRVEWSGGSFLREYTALIDPPVYGSAAPQSVAQPREVGTDQSYQSGTIDSQPIESQAYDQIVADDEAGNDSTATDGAVVDSAISSSDSSSSTPSYESTATDAQYGPVSDGESLSVIAQELQSRFPDLSIYQIMQVLFQENQSAFINGNINGLIKGSILNVGDLNAIRSVDVEQSKEFFRNQLSEWDPSALASSSDDSINVGQDEYVDSDSSSGDFDSSVADTVDSFQVGASSEQDDFISSDQGESREGEVLALRQELSTLEVSLKSSEEENQELTDRVNSLEEQLRDMKRLVSLNVEDSELSELESTLAAQNEAIDESSSLDEFLTDTEEQAGDLLSGAEESLDEFGVGVDEVLDDGNDLLADGGDLIDGAESTVDDFLADAQDGFDDTVGDIADGAESAFDGVTEGIDEVTDGVGDAVEEVESAVPPAVSPPVIEKPQSFMEKAKSAIFDGGLWKVIAGLGGLLVAGIGLLLFRRRQADEEFEISMLSIESNSHTIANSEDSASMSMSHTASVADEAINPDKETSFLTVYSDSDAVVQADEVDPVAEADVYIAYGRDEQAEEVLLDGVASHPDRVDIKHKLLTLYHKRQNVEGFERIAEELYSQRASLTGDVWQEVSQMGTEIAPNNPLFGLSGDDLSAAIDTDSELQVATDKGEQANESAPDAEKKEDESDVLEFNSAADEPKADDVSAKVDEASELVVESLSNDESIQLINFDDGRSEISELDEVEIDALDLSQSIDLDGDVLELNSTDNSDLAELNSGLETSFSDTPEVSDLEIDADYDEARTQYELAKVFVDLGDEDGARKILVELVADEKNSASVLEDARSLLDSINA